MKSAWAGLMSCASSSKTTFQGHPGPERIQCPCGLEDHTFKVLCVRLLEVLLPPGHHRTCEPFERTGRTFFRRARDRAAPSEVSGPSAGAMPGSIHRSPLRCVAGPCVRGRRRHVGAIRCGVDQVQGSVFRRCALSRRTSRWLKLSAARSCLLDVPVRRLDVPQAHGLIRLSVSICVFRCTGDDGRDPV